MIEIPTYRPITAISTWLTARGTCSPGGPVDEHAKTFNATKEPQAKEPEEDLRKLTQRELVRLSLLRCPPSPSTSQPRR